MKTLIAVMMFMPMVAWSCPQGYIEWEGTCSQDLKPAESAGGANANWVSNEKPPRTATGEWQIGKVNAVDIRPTEKQKQSLDDLAKKPDTKPN